MRERERVRHERTGLDWGGGGEIKKKDCKGYRGREKTEKRRGFESQTGHISALWQIK